MKRNQFFESKYLSKDDFPKPCLCTVDRVTGAEVDGDDGSVSHKPVLFVRDPSYDINTGKGIILNITNWSRLEEITGSNDTDDWSGHQIVVYDNPDVEFRGKRTGGLRIRAPKTVLAQPASTAPAPSGPLPDPTLTDEEIPF